MSENRTRFRLDQRRAPIYEALEQFLKEKHHWTAWIGFGASLGCLAIFGRDFFMIPTMVVILLLLTVFRKPIEEKGGYQE